MRAPSRAAEYLRGGARRLLPTPSFLLLCALLLSGCVYFGTQKRMQEFDDITRAYARAITWSNFEAAYSVTRDFLNDPKPDAAAFQDLKVTAYELAAQKVEEDGTLIHRIVKIRFVRSYRMIERAITVDEEWRYSTEQGRWILESGLPPFL